MIQVDQLQEKLDKLAEEERMVAQASFTAEIKQIEKITDIIPIPKEKPNSKNQKKEKTSISSGPLRLSERRRTKNDVILVEEDDVSERKKGKQNTESRQRGRSGPQPEIKTSKRQSDEEVTPKTKRGRQKSKSKPTPANSTSKSKTQAKIGTKSKQKKHERNGESGSDVMEIEPPPKQKNNTRKGRKKKEILSISDESVEEIEEPKISKKVAVTKKKANPKTAPDSEKPRKRGRPTK